MCVKPELVFHVSVVKRQLHCPKYEEMFDHSDWPVSGILDFALELEIRRAQLVVPRSRILQRESAIRRGSGRGRDVRRVPLPGAARRRLWQHKPTASGERGAV